MNKMVFAVFKTIAFAMIFVFVWDMVFYLYRVANLNQRAESLMTSLQKVVMENNCLPDGSRDLYEGLIDQMSAGLNSTSTYSNSLDNSFVCAWDWNATSAGSTSVSQHKAKTSTDGRNWTDMTNTIYANRQVWNEVSKSFSNEDVNILHLCMSEPGNYGDIQVVQLRFLIKQPTWGWVNNDSNSKRSSVNFQNDRTDSRVGRTLTMMAYTYFVPCLKYQSVTQ